MRHAEPDEKHLVGIREDSGIGSDGKGERGDCDGCKAGALARDADIVVEVCPYGIIQFHCQTSTARTVRGRAREKRRRSDNMELSKR